MIRRLLIANRGEIVVRVARTCRRMGVAPLAVFSDADAHAMHVAACDAAARLGPAPAAESYLRGELVLEAARTLGADAVHPGYGFLSENADFAQAVLDAGLIWVGPPPAAIAAMGLKDAAKARMRAAGVPVTPGWEGEAQDVETLQAEAARIGFPLLIKARAGGGGKGMRRVDRPEAFAEALAGAAREAQASFGDPRVLLERWISPARHIEVQVFADAHGAAVHLFERDCSLQRRHQKVLEEAPAPGVSPEMRAAMGAAAVRAAQAVGYVGAGTVEFIVDAATEPRPDAFYFMEMNTRLQVEHPVTEAVTGCDLVEWQLRVAAGEPLPAPQSALSLSGWAVEARIYAEDPAAGFLPATGRLRRFATPSAVRVDTGVREGDVVTPHYDPMLAKLIAHGPTRAAALARLDAALAATRVAGCATNTAFLRRLLADRAVADGAVDTGVIEARGPALADDPPPTAQDWADAAGAALALPPAAAAWRAWGAATAAVALAWDGEAAEIAFAAECGAWSVATPAGPTRFDPGAAAAVDVGPDAVTVMRDGAAVRFGLVDPLAAAQDAGPADATARAPMPGVVTAVHVAAGDAVAAGQPLVSMEAMKMEHALRAARDGVVAAVDVAVGDQVAEGAALARLEAEA